MWKIIGCSLIKINIDNKQQINKTEDYNFAEHYVDIYTIYSDTEVRTILYWTENQLSKLANPLCEIKVLPGRVPVCLSYFDNSELH